MENQLNIHGKIISVSPEISGRSKSNSEWRKMDFVIETSGEYSRKVHFSVLNDKIEKLKNSLQVGSVGDFFFNASSTEKDGKFFTSLTCWKVLVDKNDVKAEPEIESPKVGEEESDDLPF